MNVKLPGVDTYRSTRERLVSLCAALTTEQAGAMVPTCPGWSVQDVVAHLTGIAADVLRGRVEGLGGAEWTAAQVESRRGRQLSDIAAEWDRIGPEFDRFLAEQPMYALAAASDAVVHELDVRSALGYELDDQCEDLLATARRYAEYFAQAAANAGLGAVAVECTDADGGETIALVTAASPAITLAGRPFELLWALTGRAACDSLDSLNWSDDPHHYLAYLTPYGPVPAS